MKFSIHIEPGEQGGYVVGCPALKGCWTQGRTFDEAMKNLAEAMAGCIEERLARKMSEVSPPKNKSSVEMPVEIDF